MGSFELFKSRVVVTLFGAVLLLTGATAQAKHGGTSSGGGGAFVCRNPDGTVASAELLDLFEAREINGIAVTASDEPFLDQAEKAVERIGFFDPVFAAEVDKNVAFVLEHQHVLSDAVTIPPPNDANPNYQKTGCPLEGMMYFDGERNELMINPRIFSGLISETERAAAILHEAIYKTLREKDYKPDTTSNQTRTLVGFIFNDNLDMRPVEAFLPPKGPITLCNYYDVKNTSQQIASVYFYPEGDNVEVQVVKQVGSYKFGQGLYYSHPVEPYRTGIALYRPAPWIDLNLYSYGECTNNKYWGEAASLCKAFDASPRYIYPGETVGPDSPDDGVELMDQNGFSVQAGVGVKKNCIKYQE